MLYSNIVGFGERRALWNCEWSMLREMQYSTKNMVDAAALHNKVKEICLWLENCKIIVVNRIRGVYYIAFEEKQISMLEIRGFLSTFLMIYRNVCSTRELGRRYPWSITHHVPKWLEKELRNFICYKNKAWLNFHAFCKLWLPVDLNRFI